MFSARQYRAKAFEYAERARNTRVLNEIVEYRNLGRRFTEMADNEEWTEHNLSRTLRQPSGDRLAGDGAEEAHILRCLGASLILHWGNVPRKLQRELFDSADSMADPLKSEMLRVEVARFLHACKDSRGSDI